MHPHHLRKENLMPLTTIDPNTALVVIDLQKGIAAMPTVQPIAEVITKSADLAAVFRKHNLPVVLVNVDAVPSGRAEQSRSVKDFAPGWADIVPELKQHSSDHLVTKKQWGAFTNTDLKEYLDQKKVTQVVIVGVATSIGVESTARHAFELGFNVTIATDACTDLSQESHTHSLTRIFPRLGETGTTEEVISLLEKNSPLK
jgi:nicotinamidase-related amidase